MKNPSRKKVEGQVVNTMTPERRRRRGSGDSRACGRCVWPRRRGPSRMKPRSNGREMPPSAASAASRAPWPAPPLSPARGWERVQEEEDQQRMRTTTTRTTKTPLKSPPMPTKRTTPPPRTRPPRRRRCRSASSSCPFRPASLPWRDPPHWARGTRPRACRCHHTKPSQGC